MDISNFGVFVAATFLLNITPGNDFIFVATQSISGGRKAGIISVLGISLGLLVHVTASVLGLSLLISKSIIAFEAIKWLGASYLIYLGLKSFFSKSSISFDSVNSPTDTNRLIRQGFITNVLNPKVALFFLSFLPQFADPSSPHFSLQLLMLGGWFIFSGTVVTICVALFFSRIRTWLTNVKLFSKIQQKVTGLALIGLGLKIAFFEKK